ncbi:MAG: hypothetical protein JSW65_00150 [Candidatus Bipolaricaulota bacterium]|nr:MAG: hypothetical protein JSW65_00150 [Candidatus Bipolaricaulota bacterium]
MREFLRRLRANPVFGLIGGMLLGAIGAGIAIAILVLVVQPLAYQATRGMRSDRDGRFVMWYWEESDSWASRHALLAELNEVYDRLLTTLEVGDASIPTPINVLVHDSLDQLTRSVVQRKSSGNEQRLTAPLDLLVGEDPTGGMSELIASYGWGECQSLILKNGLRAALAEPDRDFHAIVAASGTQRLSLEELLEVESNLHPTLYQIYASPYSQSMVGSLSDIARMMRIEDVALVPLSDLPTLHAASLVRFIIERFGLMALRGAWGSGTTTRLLARLNVPLVDLDREWQEAADAARDGSPQFAYYVAYFHLAQGRPDSAYELASSWAAPRTDGQSELVVRTSLMVGAFDEARSALATIEGPELYADLARLVSTFDGWTEREDGSGRVLAPAEDEAGLTAVAETARKTIDSTMDLLEIGADDLPERITVFLHPSHASLESAATLIPDMTSAAATLHVLLSDADEELRWWLAERVPGFVYGREAFSRLVRSGVASAVLHEPEDLVEHACGLLAANKWIWLERLDFNRSDIDNVLMEAGLMFRYVLDTWGAEAIREIWLLTSDRSQIVSLETALERVCGVGRKEIEEQLFDGVLRCP